jgi:hypothetical protein
MIGGYDRALFMQFTSLKTVRGSAVTIIGDWTFRFCHALTTADFPQVTSIGDYAFDGCAALTTVDFPLVTSIGRDAFQNTGNKTLVITLPQNAPILSSGNSSSYTYSKTVTIKTPAGRTGYDSAWESLFKAAFDTQASITLIFEDP